MGQYFYAMKSVVFTLTYIKITYIAINFYLWPATLDTEFYVARNNASLNTNSDMTYRKACELNSNLLSN